MKGTVAEKSQTQSCGSSPIFGYFYLLIALLYPFHAEAAPVVCSPTMTVGTETELADAIQCYNTGTGNATIGLNADIYPGGPIAEINPVTDRQLDISGNGFVIQSAADGDGFSVASGRVTFSDVMLNGARGAAVRVTGGATVDIIDSELKNVDFGIVSSASSADVSLRNSVIVGARSYGIRSVSGKISVIDSTLDDSQRSGIYSSGGRLELYNTTISNGFYGAVYIDGGTASIENSTLSGNRLNGVDVHGGDVLIVNSTVSGNRIGVNAGSGKVSIGNSTVSYNNDNGVEANGAQIKVFSSLVAFNAQGGPYSNCLQFSGSLQIIGDSNSSYTSDGSCSSFSIGGAVNPVLMQNGDLMPLADNGCVDQQQAVLSPGQFGARCIYTHNLDLTSDAVGTGDCSGTSANPAIPGVSQDQRGSQRTLPCDSGAIEADGGTSITQNEISLVTSCLAGNGRVDLNIVNTQTASSAYRFEFQGQSPKQVTVAFEDWGRMPITGRPPGTYSATVKRDGMTILSSSLTFYCNTSAPNVSAPELTILNACRASNGYVLFQLVNPTATSRPYVIEFDGVPNRSTTAAAFGQAVRATTGRPDGTYAYLVRTGSTVIEAGQVTVDCD